MSQINELHMAINKAKQLGYISQDKIVFKNKDETFWTQPKDPLNLLIEKIKTKSNIHSEDLFTQEKDLIETAFLPESDRSFIKNYADEQFASMIRGEGEQLMLDHMGN